MRQNLCDDNPARCPLIPEKEVFSYQRYHSPKKKSFPPSPTPAHTHISPPLPSLGLSLDVRGYCSRRFHVQSFRHVFQVLIKLYDQKEVFASLRSVPLYDLVSATLFRCFVRPRIYRTACT